MRKTPYYSVRTGRRSARIDFNELRGLFIAAFQDLRTIGHFQQVLGTQCVDGDSPGSAGSDLEVFFFRKLKKRISGLLRTGAETGKRKTSST